MTGSQRIPEPAAGPDPSKSDDWEGATGDYPPRGTTLSGIVRTRETRESKYGAFEALDVEGEDGRNVHVPGFRSHLAELIEKYDPRPNDGISITFFGPEEGQRKALYGMRVSKNGTGESHSLLDAEPSEAAKVSRAVNEPLDQEAA
jgi:hypothetical protein